MSDINKYISSFGNFIVYCKESDIEKELSTKIVFEFLDNPKKYNNPEIIKTYLSEILDIDKYIQLINRLNI